MKQLVQLVKDQVYPACNFFQQLFTKIFVCYISLRLFKFETNLVIYTDVEYYERCDTSIIYLVQKSTVSHRIIHVHITIRMLKIHLKNSHSRFPSSFHSRNSRANVSKRLETIHSASCSAGNFNVIKQSSAHYREHALSLTVIILSVYPP